jgi:hypothetical protein
MRATENRNSWYKQRDIESHKNRDNMATAGGSCTQAIVACLL